MYKVVIFFFHFRSRRMSKVTPSNLSEMARKDRDSKFGNKLLVVESHISSNVVVFKHRCQVDSPADSLTTGRGMCLSLFNRGNFGWRRIETCFSSRVQFTSHGLSRDICKFAPRLI